MEYETNAVIILFKLVLVFIGYLFFETTSSENTGGCNKFDIWLSKKINKNISSSLKFETEYYHIHIHHWLYCAIFILSGLYFKCDTMYFFSGGFLHGIFKYNDWYKVITEI